MLFVRVIRRTRLAPRARVAPVLYAPGPDGTYCVRQCAKRVRRSYAQAVASPTIARIVSARALVHSARRLRPSHWPRPHVSPRLAHYCRHRRAPAAPWLRVAACRVQTAALLTIAGAVSLCARSAYAAVTGALCASRRLAHPNRDRIRPYGTLCASRRLAHYCRDLRAPAQPQGLCSCVRRCAKRVHHGHAPTVTSLIGGVSSVHAAWCKPSPGSRPCYIWTVCKHFNLRLALASLVSRQIAEILQGVIS
ncbi:hypothetical protein B0H14DRAFT_3877231 [Mycena olivaceomarginata]|nr:hypothetical protein B0H14DRAFT_3877231 [Mycena olivaceomarginata]